MDQLEIELKFYIADLDHLRQQIADLGAACIRQRMFEHNVRYETADDRLVKGGCLLRLRRDHTTTMTFKGPSGHTDARFKIARELEVQVDDFDTMDAILKALGFIGRQVYQKWREMWRLDGVTLCLDTLPFGTFMEIEGAPEAITAMVAKLGLPWRRRIIETYLGIFSRLCELEGWTFGDVSFDNFGTVDVRFDRHRHCFEVEGGC